MLDIFLEIPEVETSLILDKFSELHILLVEFRELARGEPNNCLA
jgi:hypothetical protein